MDRLHHMLRQIGNGKAERPRDHLTVFREFLAHLEKASRAGHTARERDKPAGTRPRRARRP